jgi:hypothetical protein
MHSGFHQSDWTDQEIGYAMGRNKPSFAVNYGPVSYGFIGKFQAFYGGTKSANVITDEIVAALRVHPDTRVAVCRAIAKKFGTSALFTEARG